MTDDTLMTVMVKRSPAGLMAMLKAKSIARYRLHNVPGRPEELEENLGQLNPIGKMPDPNAPAETYRWDDPAHYLPPKIISFGYIHGSVRVRQHGGERNREWVDHRDITFRDGWLGQVFEYLDPFFHYTDPFALPAGRQLEFDVTPLRPIRDNPQA